LSLEVRSVVVASIESRFSVAAAMVAIWVGFREWICGAGC